MKIVQEHNVSECRQCPFCDTVKSEKKNFVYDVCTKEYKLLPESKLVVEHGIFHCVIIIPDWCPYKEVK